MVYTRRNIGYIETVSRPTGRGGILQRYGSARRTAVIYARDPAWLDIVGSLVRRLDVDVAAAATGSQRALQVVRDARPDLLYAVVSRETSDDVNELVSAASPLVRSAVIAVGEESDPPLIRSVLAAGARAYVRAAAAQGGRE